MEEGGAGGPRSSELPRPKSAIVPEPAYPVDRARQKCPDKGVSREGAHRPRPTANKPVVPVENHLVESVDNPSKPREINALRGV